MRSAILGLVLLAGMSAVAAAQCLPQLLPPDAQQPCGERYPDWTGEMAALGANALLGGLSGGVMQKLHGGSFGTGFLRGLAGGAVVYGGKRIAVERFGGAGLVGRQVAAVGGSMVRNAGEGRGMVERVALPVGPAWLHMQGAVPRVRLRVDAFALGWFLYALQESELELDAGMSLSAGTPVFLTQNRIIITGGDTAHASGAVKPGNIMIADVRAFGREYSRRTFEHERVHVLQMDQIFLTMTGPAETELMRRTPWLRRLEPYVVINLSGELLELLGGQIPEHLNRPWETEAIFFSR
jgi:hypothetical protein